MTSRSAKMEQPHSDENPKDLTADPKPSEIQIRTNTAPPTRPTLHKLAIPPTNKPVVKAEAFSFLTDPDLSIIHRNANYHTQGKQYGHRFCQRTKRIEPEPSF